MKRLCDCGCRRPAHGEWLHPTLGAFTFAALCNLRNRAALELTGFAHFPELDDTADHLVGNSAGNPRECG